MINKKTYLILINAAFKMGQFHINFGDYLKKDGHKVIYAFADKLPFYTEGLNLDPEEFYMFSDFFKRNYQNLNFDKKYNKININKLFFSDYDRNIIHQKMPHLSHDHYERLMINLINFFHEIISENKIDICIYESISNSFAYSAFEVLRLNNIPYCGYAGSRLKGRFELYTEEFGSVEEFKKIFLSINLKDTNEESLKYIDTFLENYTKDTEMPSYHPKGTHLDWNYSLIKKYFNFDKLRLMFGSLKFVFKDFNSIKFSYQIGNPVIELLRNFKLQLQKQFRIRFAIKYFVNPSISERYYIFPQHFKPESSTSVLARHYCDDLALITNIAFNLPFGVKLYVKEHFVNFGKLPLSYYESLKKIPNVKLISHEEDIKKLLINCIGVITLSSTVGFEALLYNKPVFVFGNVFYQCHPNCFKINSYDQLENILNTQIKRDLEINKRFVLAYYKNTVEGNVYYNLPNVNFTQESFNKQFSTAINEKFFIQNV